MQRKQPVVTARVFVVLFACLLSACGSAASVDEPPPPGVASNAPVATAATSAPMPTVATATTPINTPMPTVATATTPIDTPVPTVATATTPINTPMPTVATATTPVDIPVPTAPAATAPPAPVVLAAGSFIAGSVPGDTATGNATIYQLADQSRVLRLDDFAATNGPDLFVVLSPNGSPEAEGLGDYIILDGLKGLTGNQNYNLPAELDLAAYRSVVIWCRAFNIVFGYATVQ